MKSLTSALAAAVMMLFLGAGTLAAQLFANPVYFSPKGPNGLTVAVDFGTTLQTQLDDVEASAKPNNVGARAILGLPMFSVGVGAGIFNPDVSGLDKEVQLSGQAAVKIFSPPLLPVGVSLQAGAAYLQQGSGATAVKFIDVPLGLAVGVKPPSPAVSFEAWAAPRVQLRRVSFTGSSATQAGIGASAGVNLGMPMGLGLHLAADWSRLSRKTSGTINLGKTETLIFGVGLHYTFTIPGIPMVPVI
ncbi:hypothetical protein HRbin33_00421 [bacterium HR33]|nr:hypothetical protein HRbin33_00421 [bacterium HR33]